MYYTFRDFNLTLNGFPMFCSDAEMTINATTDPNYTVGNRSTRDYVPRDGINGDLRINYYLTGIDYLKNFFSIEDTPISGNIGGLYFRSGYLTNYQLSCLPNSPATINANIKFFEQVTGIYNPVHKVVGSSSSSSSPNPPVIGDKFAPLILSDAYLTQMDYSAEYISNVLSLNYVFNCDVKGAYSIRTGLDFRNITPDRVVFGIKTIQTELIYDTITGTLPMRGEECGLILNFAHPNISAGQGAFFGDILEQFTTSGYLVQRTILAGENQTTKNKITIKQDITENLSIVQTFLHFP